MESILYYLGLNWYDICCVVHTYSSRVDAVAKLVTVEIGELSSSDHHHYDADHDSYSDDDLDNIHRLG